MSGSTYAPAAIWAVYNRVHSRIPSSQMGGIVPGPSEQRYGYHWAAALVASNDDSRHGAINTPIADMWAGSALDITLTPSLMKTCTQRLLTAAKNKDPRMKVVREFGGTTDGVHTHSYELTERSEQFDVFDSSHLHHIHISFGRKYSLNTVALLPVADVLTGVALPKPTTGSSISLASIYEDDNMKILVVSQADCKAKKVTWPGYFLANGVVLQHIPTPAQLNTIRRRFGYATETISVSEYRALGGK